MPTANPTVSPTANPDALPQLKHVEAVKLARFGKLYGLLSQWAWAGAKVPFTLQDLQEQFTEDEGICTQDLLRELLGDLWACWFPTTSIAPSDVLPKQAVLLIREALGALKTNYDSGEASKAAASSGFALFTEQCKKRKTAAQAEV